jgi:hypothetical protein
MIVLCWNKLLNLFDTYNGSKTSLTDANKIFKLEEDENTELFEYFVVNSFELINTYYALALSANNKSQSSNSSTVTKILDANELKKGLQVTQDLFSSGF